MTPHTAVAGAMSGPIISYGRLRGSQNLALYSTPTPKSRIPPKLTLAGLGQGWQSPTEPG